MNLKGLIVDANMRLKNQNLNVNIFQKGSKLYIRGYFPIKSGEAGLERQDLSLGFTASLVGLHLAEAEAIKIAQMLKQKAMIGVQATKANVKKQLSQANLIHLATHGQFSSNPNKTFLLASDKRIQVAELDILLKSREQQRTEPIELLVLRDRKSVV